MRKIVHIDMDAFYASVEQLHQPDLRGLPVIVAWSEAPRGVVLAASYEARKFGVHSAMPALRARKLCPEGKFIRPDFERYKAISRQVRAIFERHTHMVEPLSLDEAYLDVTEELTGLPTATETARTIREEIRAETGLTASAGVAPNKFLAKIASDWKKPDGMFVIRPGDIEQFLIPLPVRKIPGVGRVTEQAMLERGIQTVGDLRTFGKEQLSVLFGSFGERLWELARGLDDSPVIADRETKSISSENTFSDDINMAEVADFLRGEAPRLWESVKKHELQGRTVTVKLRDSAFVTATRRITPQFPPENADELLDLALALLPRFAFPEGSRFRLAGIGLSNFMKEEEKEGEEKEQPTLF